MVKVTVTGLVCPNCGYAFEASGLTMFEVKQEVGELLKFELRGLSGHRCRG